MVKIGSADLLGITTKPNQPAFLVIPNADQDNIATSTDVTKVFGNELFDVGSNFATNTFTAPVTGKYQLNFSIMMKDIDSAITYTIKFITSNRTYLYGFDPRQFAGDILSNFNFTESLLVDMDASDTAFVAVNQAAGAPQTDLINQNCRFSGFLVA